MRCPFCGNGETLVRDSRLYDNGDAVRRRRQCSTCDSRFSTMENVIYRDVTIVKKDGSKTGFDKRKLYNSIKAASGKRISDGDIGQIVNDIMRRLESSSSSEVKSSVVGNMVMDKLERIDKISYIRFASAYMNFENPEDFNNFIRKISS